MGEGHWCLQELRLLKTSIQTWWFLMGFRGVRPSSDFEQIISEISVEPCSYYSGTEQTGTGP